MTLTEKQIKSTKPSDRRYTLYDDNGLFLYIFPNGTKTWGVRMYVQKKEFRLTFGDWPDICLKEARIKAVELKVAELKKAKEPDLEENAKNLVLDKISFKDLAEEWLKVKMSIKKPSYLKTIRIRLARYIFPAFGDMYIGDITSAAILSLCREIEGRGTPETAARVKQEIGQILRYGMATLRIGIAPTYSIRGALEVREGKHMAALTKEADIRRLMIAIHSYPRPIMRRALMFSALTFARPGEVRHAEWHEINFKDAV